jgi:soluble lytic murein transglycosylase-like protein
LNTNVMNGAPCTRRKPRLRSDTRSLLRSRAVQMMLVGAAAVQTLAVAQGRSGHQAQPGSFSEATVAASLAPVVARPFAAAVRVERATAPSESKVAAAEALAEKYRDKGFAVSSRLAQQIHDAAVANGIAPEIAFGLVKTESGFKNSATSHVGAVGLTQLMPATARWLKPGVTVRELRNSETNLRIGFRYLRDLLRKYDGDTELALLAYNRGPGTVDRVLRRGGDPDNGYADMVMGRRNRHR